MNYVGKGRLGNPSSALGRHLGLEQLERRQLMTVSAASSPVAVPLYEELTTVKADGTVVPLASSGPTGYTPAQIRHAYGFDQISFSGGTVAGDGSGQTIAIVDAYDDPNIANDLHQFDLAFGLADPSFVKVNQNGGSAMPQADAGWSAEIALDVEWAHAIAPKAKIVLVEASDASYTNLMAAVNYARNVAGVAAVSMSWGGGEFSSEVNYDSYFTTPAGHSGVAFVVASGDSGAPAEYPATSPNVLSVGGTSLRLTSSSTISSESAWSGSTGGLSAYESEPSYQAGVVTQTTTRRATPDVSYDSDPNTGFPVYDSYGTSLPWAQYGGTSDAAPQWAALIAIADQGRVLNGLPAITGSQVLQGIYYMPSSYFHDVTSGSSAGSPAIAATAGYDLATGRGTPVANAIVYAWVGSSTTTTTTTPATHFSASAPSSSTAGNTFSITVSALGASNTTATGYTGTVRFSSSDTLAGLPANYTFTAADNGAHTFTGLTLKTAGADTLSIADTASASITGTTTITVSPAVATHLAFVQQPSSAVAGSAISPAVTVRVLDAYNNLVTSDSGRAIAIGLGSNPSGGTLSGTTSVTDSGGTATFNGASINLAGSGYTLVASTTGLVAATSNSFNVTSTQTTTTTSGNVVESFENGLGNYWYVGAPTASVSLSSAAAHDGSTGLVDSNGNDWVYRTDAAAQVKQGDTISVWVQFAGAADGRAYLGFGTSAAGSLSLVAAANTGQLVLQNNAGYNYVNLATATQTWLPNHWYRLEVDWGASGTIVGKVFDSNGTTLLQSVTGATTAITSGGIGFRGFGSNKYWDTVTVSSGVNNFTTASSGTTTAGSSSLSTGTSSSSSASTSQGLLTRQAAAVQQIFSSLSSSSLGSGRAEQSAAASTVIDELTLELLARGVLRTARR